jgi:hypothetical protein
VWDRTAESKTPQARNRPGARADFGAGPRPRDHFTALEVTPMGFKIGAKDELDDLLEKWVKDINTGL